MEKPRQKPRIKKVKKKIKNESTEPEISGCEEASTSVSDELHQAMQDFQLTDTKEDSPTPDMTSSITEDMQETESSVPLSESPPQNVAEFVNKSPEEIASADAEIIEIENQNDSTENPYADIQNLLDNLKEEVHVENEEFRIPTPEVSASNLMDEISAPILTDEISNSEQNICQPSAPESSICQYVPTEQIVQQETKKPYLDNDLLKIIQPFTETQLSSLYHNHEIDFSKEYIKEFIESQKSLQNHKLYEMLSTYLRARNKLIATQLEIDNYNKEYKEHQEQIWSLEDTTVTESGKCQDGNSVSVSHKYPVANLNKQSLNSVSRSLSSIRDLVNEVYTLHAYSSEVLRLQIEHFMQEILIYYSNIPHNTPVQLYQSNNIQKIELCTCISILFMFQRRPIKDSQFVTDTREWLLRLSATLLRIATAREHLFLLHHILRSPGGVSNWAISLIQIPMNSLLDSRPSTSSALLDHAIAVLSVLMNPIYEREQFIDDKRSLELDPWVFLDSDGDEEDEQRGLMSLLENDLVAILNQIPIDSIFRHVLGIQRRDNREIYYAENVSENSLLQLFAFATTVVQLLRTGLQTYNTPRYRQFAKRLGRLVRHTVQYVSEQWEVFRQNSFMTHDPAMLARLQVEYDSLLLRATQCIFSSQRLGAWQFLAVVPYNVASSAMLWRLFCLLHQEYHEGNSFCSSTHHQTDWQAEVSRPELRLQFESKLTAMPEAEAYFLLNTFASMALARGPEDRDFVLAATLDLFQVGFASKATQDACCKTARSLLTNLLTKHPPLTSSLLEALKQSLDTVGSLSLYLVKELPLQLWTPEAADMTTLSEWLLSAPNSLQSSVARSVFAALDWSTLAPPLQLHAALVTVDACLRHAPERSGHTSPGGVAEGVSSLAAMVRTQTSPEQGLNSWAWGLLSRLRLHLNDRATRPNLPDDLRTIPDLESNDNLEVLTRGVREKEPIACFAALLATTWGHSVPLICTKGVPLLATLLAHSKYDALCEALHHITPLFMDCPESLISSDKFLSLFSSLITADRGYVKMAKNLLIADSPGPVLRQVANMIESQFANCHRYGLDCPHLLTGLWLTVLTSLPDWTREPSVAHLLDVTLRASYLHPVAREVASIKLRALYRNGVAKQGGALSSLLSWVSGSGLSSLLPRPACPEAPWLALFVLEVEQDENEARPGLWRQLLLELADPGKPSLDQAIKRAASVLKVAAVPPGSLAVYRWAQQALDTSLDHPLLPIFWQRFFSLYLARVPLPPQGGPDRGSMGHRMFEGLVNVSYLKRLRRRLHDAAELYEARAVETGGVSGEGAEEEGGDRRALSARTSRMLRTLSLWLEEPRLQEPNLYLPALPPQYDPNRLGLVFSGDNSPWLEFVDLQAIQETQIDAVRDWQLQHFRHVDGSFRMLSPQPGQELGAPTERMLKRLRSYDHPLPAPTLKALKPVVPFLARGELSNPAITLASLEQQFAVLLEFAQVHSLRTSELAALDCGLLELLPALYRDSEVKVNLTSACEAHARKKATECAGAFRVAIKVCESRINEATQHHMTQNRNEHKSLLARSLQSPPQGVCGAAVYTENVVAKLVSETQGANQRQDADLAGRLKETGVAVFYHLVSKYNEESAFYPPTKQLLTSCLEMLGQVFISGDSSQCERLLDSLLSQPHLSGLLSPHFAPQLAPTPAFLSMYQRVVSGSQSSPDSSFVLLSKFDVNQWLQRARPRLRERSQFIETLGEALTSSGREPPRERLVIHEIFLRHLRHITLHQFPEHYGEVLQLILRCSEAQNLALDAWWCLLDALTPGDQPRLRPTSGPIREQLRVYATQQRLLGPQEVRETAALLASYFTKERLQYGLHGLYPKYRHYMEPLSIFLGMIGHSLVIGTLHLGRGALGDTLSEQIWPILNDLFAPWLTPYTGQRLRQQSASWIQQLTDDRTVLLPWTAQDSSLAKLMTDSFVDIVQFLLDTLPACSNILCFVWQFYVMNFTLASVKEHVLNVIHTGLASLPWERFWPRGQDVEAMLKVTDQYLPNCHSFLGLVFVQVPWVSWMSQVQATCPLEQVSRSHVSLMTLLVKLSAEPSLKQNPRVVPLVAECQKQLSWHLVDAATFDTVLNWFVMSADPRVILPKCPEVNPVDVAVLELLQEIAGYCPETRHFHPTTLRKRLAFVRACAKQLVSSASRFKAMLTKNQLAFASAAHRLLDQVENVIHHTVPPSQQIAESSLLLGELLSATSVSAPLAAILVPATQGWLSKRSGRSVVVLGLLRTLGVSVTDQKALGTLLEETLTAYFRDTGAPNISWGFVVSILQPAAAIPKSQQPWEPLEHTLVKDGNLLALHAFVLKRNPQDKTEQATMLANLTEWMSAVKVSESVERKLPLLWKLSLSLCLSLCQKSVCEDGTLEPPTLQKLNQFIQYLIAVGEDKGWDILGAIGLRKQTQASVKLRLLARTLAAFLLVQLPTSGEADKRRVRLSPESPGALGDISSSCVSDTLTAPAPSSQALQAVASLESLGGTKLNPPELRATLDHALTAIRDPANHLASFDVVFYPVLSQLYQDPFLTL